VITVPREEDYRESLDALRSDIESMSEDVLDQLLCALDALERDDHELAREVIDGDDRINQQYLNLEGDCVDLIALQQPVASDLRFIVASFKILTDLERIGDLATNLARYALSGSSEIFSKIRIENIGETAYSQLQMAIEAYMHADSEACRVISDRDDELDASCQTASEAIVRDLVASEPDRWEIEQLLDDVSRLLLTVEIWNESVTTPSISLPAHCTRTTAIAN